MAKNSPEPVSVSAIDPRDEFAADLDARIITLEARNRALAAQRKQLDLETQANDDAIRVARDGLTALDAARIKARELALAEQQ